MTTALLQFYDSLMSVIVVWGINPGCREMHHLCNIGSMVTNSLDVARHEQQLRRAGDRGRIFHHVTHKIAENAVIERINLVVRFDHFQRKVWVTRGLGGQYVMHHLTRQFTHGGKQG